MVLANSFVQKVLIANGIGDITVGLILLLASYQLTNWLDFSSSIELTYLAGGWGIAAITFGLLRFFAGYLQNQELCWFVPAFGLFEGIFLTCFGLSLTIATKLSFFQVSLSTIFALVFSVAYGISFYVYLNRQKLHPK